MEAVRLVLIHWNREEGPARAESLRQAGFAVEWLAPGGMAGMRELLASPPQAILIDLSRLPSQSQAVALELRRRKSTRGVPMVILGGLPEKIERLRALLPDAVYTDWSRAPAAIREAIEQSPSKPVTPGPMAAYSGVPLAQKLGICSARVLGLAGAPEGFAEKLGALPEGAQVRARGPADRLLLFVTSLQDLERRFEAAARRVKPGGGLWIVWPKRSAQVKSDLTQTVVRRFGLDAGWVDYKICAVDETWSGLLFARRGSTRPQ
jgi:hypothetical protein